MNTFEHNIESLIILNPSLGSRVFAIEENDRYEVFQEPTDPLNINILDRLTGSLFYEGRPQDEILAQVDRFEQEFSRYPILFIYGIANALFVKLLLKNTNHTHIIVIEPEIELLYIAYNLIDFSTEIEQRRLYFFEHHEIDFVRAVGIFSDSQIKVFCKTYHLEPNIPYYENHYGESLVQCNAHLVRAIHHVVTGLGNDTTDALIGLEWHLANVSKMVETPTLLELIQKMKTTKTAIIISTGPSLAKQLPLLKTIKDNVTLLSVDASLPILEQYGIKPDIVFSIERVAETAEFYQRTSREFQEGIICAMSSLSHPLLVESVNGATLQMSMRPFGYTRYFNQPEYGYIGIGMSAANMAYEAAFHAKFENIILIGQDLAYGEEGKSHSDGHIFGALKRRKDDVEVEAYGGNGTVLTSVIWNMFRNFFENDIHIASQEGVMTINATEGGARIHGSKELSFSEAIELCIDKNIVKEKIILTPPNSECIEAKHNEIEAKIAFMLEYVTETQVKVSKLFEQVAECVERLDKINGRKNLEKIDYDEIANLMEQIDEVKALFDDQQFVDIFIDATQALIVHHELEIARIQVRPIQNDDDRRLKMIDWIYAHHHWLFALAGIMEAELVAIQRRGEQSGYVHKAKLSDDGDSIIGYFYDFSKRDTHFEIDLIIDNELIFSKKIKIVYPQKGNFIFFVPANFYNDQVHDIILREKNTGIVLSGMPERRIFLSANRAKAEFMASFDRVYPEKIKKIYCKNAIGFLAVKENLEDDDYIRYLNEILELFPQVKLKAFYFDDEMIEMINVAFYNSLERVIWIKPQDIYCITNEIEAWIQNSVSMLDSLIRTTIMAWVPFNYFEAIKMMESLEKYERDNAGMFGLFTKNLEFFGFDPFLSKQYGISFYEIFYNSVIQKIRYGHKKIVPDMSLQELSFLRLEMILSSEEFKKAVITLSINFQKILNQ
ncbi:6-hydroxymethylpterin diphosphokinase MptE-like protein [Sulfuricurvum sp.]|uniref:motility associated factor glycosyltransferase family protein n=1 Tax=Sulfuricurvum sp. TaxID=2025608 RepID=UPI0026232160|nr:6-hydroxymethylpterin diphosphokinase MptE-like protein [Sulfuricurvum sp.]MDD2780464.1 DUF115 domain-containing protein [Sulfuricurvum sp.]